MNNSVSVEQERSLVAASRPWGIQLWAVACLGSVLMAAAGHLLIKMGLLRLSNAAHGSVASTLLRYILQPLVFGGLSIYALGTLLWVFAVARKEISFLYPLTALNYGLLALAGHIVLGESISLLRWFGISIVMVGVVLMQWSGQTRSQ